MVVGELSFVIESVPLFVKAVLISYSAPLLFVCQDDMGELYLAFCPDADKESYVITRTNLDELNDLFERKITMLKAFISKENCYVVYCSREGIYDDKVNLTPVKSLNLGMFPPDASFNLPEPKDKLLQRIKDGNSCVTKCKEDNTRITKRDFCLRFADINFDLFGDRRYSVSSDFITGSYKEQMFLHEDLEVAINRLILFFDYESENNPAVLGIEWDPFSNYIEHEVFRKYYSFPE